MKKAVFAFLVFFGYSVSAQVEFEKGYFVQNSGEKVECYILNSEWYFNPSKFQYKISENSEVKTLSVNDARELHVGEYYFFPKTVQFDASSMNIDDLSEDRAPQFENRKLFLRKLLDSKVDLYSYQANSVTRFFMEDQNGVITPLVYKKFKTGGKISENHHYRQQLSNLDGCNENLVSSFERINYSKRSLIDYFQKYNECLGAEVTVLKVDASGKFNINLKVGAGIANFEVEKGLTAGGTEFSGIEPRFGAELEYVLPFYRNKFAIYAEATYRSISGKEPLSGSLEGDLTMKYSSMELSPNVRYYMFLNNRSSIFLNIGFVLDHPLESEMRWNNTNLSQDPFVDDFEADAAVKFGLGYKFMDRVAISVDYFNKYLHKEKEVPSFYYIDLGANHSSFNINLSYSIL